MIAQKICQAEIQLQPTVGANSSKATTCRVVGHCIKVHHPNIFNDFGHRSAAASVEFFHTASALFGDGVKRGGSFSMD
ncbi:MAG: hypothetical protein Q8908_08630 [Bacteroidota bacterium]|nr:hypothetical protein [Bacteroidota bacterium]